MSVARVANISHPRVCLVSTPASGRSINMCTSTACIAVVYFLSFVSVSGLHEDNNNFDMSREQDELTSLNQWSSLVFSSIG